MTTEFESCRASFVGQELTISNDLVERRWRVENGLLYATSLLDRATQTQWITRPSTCPALHPPLAVSQTQREISFSAKGGQHGPVERPSLQVDLTSRGKSFSATFRFKIFPHVAAISSQLIVDGAISALQHPEFAPPQPPSGIESNNGDAHFPPAPDVIDAFDIAPLHVDLMQVTLLDQSDVRDNLVFENRWMLHPAESQIRLAGNLFILENRLTGDGLILLKESPLPHARPIKTVVDFELRGSSLRLYGHGIDESGGAGYRTTIIPFSRDRLRRAPALHSYQRALRPCVEGRDALLMSSTWGDRSKDAKISEKFILDELAAAEKLGVDLLAIDAGWEKRAPKSPHGSSVWTGYWSLADDYWTPDPRRFPRGLEPIAAAAKERHLQIGLWYVADASNDYANWKRDADHILHLHRTLGVDHFKLDGVKFFSRTGEARLARLYQTLLIESKGKIAIDQDITANLRPGYFGQIDAGPLFVENRYTDWHRYWPHATLRTLWQLSHYIDPQRLRMEFLNPERNADVYGDDPLAPAKYRADYLFASVMLASPLAWFENTGLSGQFIASAAPLIATWKTHRARFSTAEITPIGAKPDGTSWTGFALKFPGGSGELLVFRELTARDTCDFVLPMFNQRRYDVKLLHGSGSASLADGRAAVNIHTPLGFVWLELT